MAVRELDSASPLARPPRSMVWVLILASAVAVVMVGLLATTLVFGNVGSWPQPPAAFWPRFALACVLTLASLALRSLRWIFLLRRAETRIPIRDAYIGYLAGFSLLLTPLLVGEAAVRALIHRRRGAVPILTTLVVNVWERTLDVVALVGIAGALTLLTGQRGWLTIAALVIAALTFVTSLRRYALRVMLAVVRPIASRFEFSGPHDFRRLVSWQAWTTSFGTSVVAWLMPGAGLWLLAGAWPPAPGLAQAEVEFAKSTVAGAAMLAPGGVVVAGRQLLETLATGSDDASVLLIVLGIRLATVGVSTALGLVFVAMHLRQAPASSHTHFDDIADAYDVQIPEGRRYALLDAKTALMKATIEASGVGRHGLDVGCGQGAYVACMRRLGFTVDGIDYSAGQVALAARNVGDVRAVQVGSVLDIPASDASYDFLYTINVLHHLGSVDDQRRAFAELFRVLKPGGVLFVHEINTRNALFRFYMGYVFPSMNCIDEGIERWLLPHRLDTYTSVPVVEVQSFTFLPDFIPQALARLLRPLERLLERSSLRVYSAHYMAVLRKPSGNAS